MRDRQVVTESMVDGLNQLPQFDVEVPINTPVAFLDQHGEYETAACAGAEGPEKQHKRD